MRIKMKFVRILRISFYVLSFTFYVITSSPALALENNSIVINEIAYRGTQASGYDEWIELFNSSNNEVNLSGWELFINSKSIPLLGTVQPQSYFLLERSDDQTISDITADQIFTGGLTDSASMLQLKNNGRTVDRISKWHINLGQPEENFSDRSSMERISPFKGGDLQSNWQINNQQTINGLDADGSKIFGTPRSKNSPPNLTAKNNPPTPLIHKPEKKIEKSKVVSKPTTKKLKPTKKIKPLYILDESSKHSYQEKIELPQAFAGGQEPVPENPGEPFTVLSIIGTLSLVGYWIGKKLW